jgi:transcriptional regulator
MYIPAAFAKTDQATLHCFIEQHSFALLVSQDGAEPMASHLPFLLERDCGPCGRLIGHMARANSQWRSAVGQKVLVTFAGPHAYISPSWYEADSVVPTWNYTAVHAYGTLRLVEEPAALRDIVARMVTHYEGSRPSPWDLDSQPAEFIERMLAAIVGFEIDIERLEGKWKLSQNQPAERQEKVVRALRQSESPDDLAVADLMQAGLGS